jgi:predicted site-specific integrase-resolvase
MNTYTVEHIYFYSGDVAGLIGVHRTTIWRWIQEGKIKAIRREVDNRYVVELSEINRLREMSALSPITKEDAIYYWEHGVLPDAR